MPRTLLVFVWHMHQPFYKDLASGEYQLPWTRMHALKDYYGMVQMLEEFPRIKQTFNLVPSMIAQIEEYARGDAHDPFLRCALKPADKLTPDEQALILKYFFQANAGRLIYRYPRYGELFDAWLAADQNAELARRSFSPGTMRDLQVLSQLAWFDEIILATDPEVKALVAKGRDIILLYGNRTPDAVVFREELDDLAAASAGRLRIAYIMSHAPEWPGEKGYIDQERIFRLVPDVREREVFLCGPPFMMQQIRVALAKLGVPHARIYDERFAL